jgi:hypothetical protein
MRIATALGALGLLVGASPALAANYPPPHKPGKVKHHKNNGGTLRVCKHGKHRYRTISRAVAAAGRGDTIRVCHGVYHEGVIIQGKGKDRLKLVGDPKHPDKVVIDSRGVKGVRAQNGVQIFKADHVTVKGFYARYYKGNGFFALSVDGYKLTRLLAGHGGAYGVYAFDSKGGTMSRSEAFYNNDSGFYVGQTKPVKGPHARTLVTHVKSWGNVLGFSGTNMRYVTVTKSKWFNNGLGIVPNALKSERYPPAADNVITGNDVFWNNFDYFHSAPFKLKPGATDDLAYPVGTGVLVFGGQRNIITGNRIWGNWLLGAGLFEQVLLIGDPKPFYQRAGVLVGNEIRGNEYGRGGTDLNGRDLAYDGEGRDNCIQETGVRSPTVPANGNTYEPCPFSGPNTMDAAAAAEGIRWSLDATHEANWVVGPHQPIKGIRPLVHCTVVKGHNCKGQPKL